MTEENKGLLNDSLVDSEYIKKCLNLSPSERLREMEELNEFLEKS